MEKWKAKQRQIRGDIDKHNTRFEAERDTMRARRAQDAQGGMHLDRQVQRNKLDLQKKCEQLHTASVNEFEEGPAEEHQHADVHDER